MRRHHRLPFGAELSEDGHASFRLFAPACTSIALCLDTPDAQEVEMTPTGCGWFELPTSDIAPGTRYAFRTNTGLCVPDPASRFQPEGVHGPSEVVDPRAYVWSDIGWHGRPWEEAILYELHIGTFTPDGSFRGALSRLPHLRDLGVTAIEIMPVAEFTGRRGWGYDGVSLFAPSRTYGRPEDLKALVDEAHGHGLMVILDVVYNHFGADGNYLHVLAPCFFDRRRATPWGEAIDFEGPNAETVRRYFVENALFWLEEYHLDGLRLDAVDHMLDDSSTHILEELATQVRSVFRDRPIHLLLESDVCEVAHLERNATGRPRFHTAQVSDDFHHALHVLLTGERKGYYRDYSRRPAELLARALAHGFALEHVANSPAIDRASVDRLSPTAFVHFLQNHDQVGQCLNGARISASMAQSALEASTALLLLSPSIPMLFMGQEWAAPQPFFFFGDFPEELKEAVREGRRRDLAWMTGCEDDTKLRTVPDPSNPETMARCVLDWSKLGDSSHREWLSFHRELLEIRRREVVPLLKEMASSRGLIVSTSAPELDVRWPVDDTRQLRVLANLTADPAPADRLFEGRLLFATRGLEGARRAGALRPPWSVAWMIVPRS